MSIGKECSNCGCYHDETFAKYHPEEVAYYRAICAEFDPNLACVMCGEPILRLSVGGICICPWCDCGDNSRVEFAMTKRMKRMVQVHPPRVTIENLIGDD